VTFALSLVDSEILHTPVLFRLKFRGVPFGADTWCWGVQSLKSEDPRLIAAKLHSGNSNLCDHNTSTSLSDGTRADMNLNTDGQVGLPYVRSTFMGRT